MREREGRGDKVGREERLGRGGREKGKEYEEKVGREEGDGMRKGRGGKEEGKDGEEGKDVKSRCRNPKGVRTTCRCLGRHFLGEGKIQKHKMGWKEDRQGGRGKERKNG